MSRAVCRNCWTWYSKGETACPHCHVPLTAADPGAAALGVASPVLPVGPPTAGISPPGLVQPTADAPFPAAPTQRSSSGIGWLQWLFIGGGAIAGIVVIGLIISGLLLTGALGPVKSSDNALSVKVPAGWAVAHGPAAGTVLALARLKQTAGVEPHFIVGDTGQLVPLADIEGSWQTYAESGQFPIAGTLGSVTRTTVAGTSALIADFQGSKVAGELIFVDYGRKTYLIEMSSDVSEFPVLRDKDFAAILSSWEWH